MFSSMFIGNKEGNRRKVTAMTTNSKTILLGFSDSSLSVYDLNMKRCLDKTYALSSSK